jgi:hypothetical protein
MRPQSVFNYHCIRFAFPSWTPILFPQITYIRIYQGSLKKGDFIWDTVAGKKVGNLSSSLGMPSHSLSALL